MSTKKLLSTAYHEAGHALAYLLTNRKFKYLTIIPKENSLGHISHKLGNRFNFEYGSMVDPIEFNKFFLEDFRNIAGLVAEKIYTKRNNFSGAKGDFRQIYAIGDYSDKLITKYLSFLTEYVVMVFSIKMNRIKLDVIAEVLIQKETLSYDDVLNVIQNSMLKLINSQNNGSY
jgi:ATP-dependent Zn protease